MRLPEIRRNALRSFVSTMRSACSDLFFPRVCVACDQPQLSASTPGFACRACWSRLALLPHPHCDRCGHPVGEGSCRWCPLLPPYVRAVRSCTWVPGGTAERLVHALKYDGWHGLAVELAERMGRLAWPADVIEERCAYIPVPLAEARLRERGYNQSEVLARALGRRDALPVWTDVLLRTRGTASQTRLTPEQRLHNVAGAFRVTAGAPRQLRGVHVVLVDDVITTAATMNACAAPLWDAGARIISYVTFGRARSPGDAPLSRGRA